MVRHRPDLRSPDRGARQADRIYVLERGEVIKQGDLAALMARGGLYADLYSLQAAAYAADGPQAQAG